MLSAEGWGMGEAVPIAIWWPGHELSLAAAEIDGPQSRIS